MIARGKPYLTLSVLDIDIWFTSEDIIVDRKKKGIGLR